MEIQKLKKIFAIIPEELYYKLVEANKFNSNFDEFVARAIEKALDKEVR